MNLDNKIQSAKVDVINDFNKFPKVSFNKKLNMHYHSHSHVVFANKNNLEVIGRIQNKQFVDFDYETYEDCKKYNLKVNANVLARFEEEERKFEEEWVRNILSEMDGHLPKKEKEIKIINRRNFEDSEATSDEDACYACKTNTRTIVFIPCGHRCYCNGCFETAKQHEMIQNCPLCRQDVTAVVQSV